MTTLRFRPGPAFLPQAAAAIWFFLDQCEAHGHAAAAAHVVVPTAAQIPGVRQALDRAARAAGAPRLLPRIVTIGHWMLDFPPALLETGATRSPAARLLAVQQAIRQQDWLRRAFGAQTEPAAWGLAQTILTVSDELSARWLEDDAVRDNEDVPGDDRAALLQGALERTYAHLSTRFLGEEARIVLAFWKALSGPDDPLPARRRALQALAQRVQGPVVWLAPTPPEPIDAAFLQAAGDMAPVLQIGYDWGQDSGEPSNEAANEATDWYDTLLALWPECRLPAPRSASTALPPRMLPPERPRLSVIGCARFEDEATVAADQLVRWLNEGRRQLALVAHDRVVARRARALLARAGAPVRDETGWKLSTTRAAAALMRFFDLAMADGDTAALLDLVKSPFCLPSMPLRGAAIAVLELGIRRDGITGGWRRLLQRFAPHEGRSASPSGWAAPADIPDVAGADSEQAAQAAAAALLRRLADEARAWPGGESARPVAFWLARLNAMLETLEMRAAMTHDDAGTQLLDALARLDQLPDDEAGAGATLTLAEFRAMLAALLESVAYKEPSQPASSRITILPLNGARMRRFDGVVVVGCDDAQLPSTAAELMFFSNQMRRELGLEDREARFAQQARDLAEVLLNNDDVVLTWQRFGSRGEPRHVSGWIERLALHCSLSGVRIEEARVAELHSTTARVGGMPAPSVPELAPERWSAQAYNMLRRCPYQFFAGRMLGLAGLETVSDDLEKRDIGELLHQVLLRFHRDVEQRELRDDNARLAHLRALSDEVFGAVMEQDGNAIGYYRRWLEVLPSYIAWQAAREREGWQWRGGEIDAGVDLPMPDGRPIRLHGRIDRLDRHRDGAHAVLDYKTQTASRLRRKARDAEEDCQLPFYGLLRADARAGSWVSLEDGRNDARAASPESRREVALPDFDQAVRWLQDQLQRDVLALRKGTPLPAFGDASACTYCNARGLCRKGYWESTALPPNVIPRHDEPSGPSSPEPIDHGDIDV
ncbi:ATP-dependent helicase/nuclease subunit B [Cupriavidus gilardii J11]|uniref:ATP-dependent helicase/nuclease subunit B n=1 Tax=Cupriavidus gilardii J11 TaxID=936133 RepID=A0A562BPC1_9BURK|nr:PD-(D/E)XK nuclease family protein [Cupriavidus gilardii]TWG86663.1 ATP-dependent helicase/nuclease subunit B [Cupriavidus gilardii J11]